MKRCASCRWFARMPETKHGTCNKISHREPPETWLKCDATTYDDLWVTQAFGCVLWQSNGPNPGPRPHNSRDLQEVGV